MTGGWIAALITFGSIWLIGFVIWIVALRRTHTKPNELDNEELIRRAYFNQEGDEEKK